MLNRNDAFVVGQQIREYNILQEISRSDLESVFRTRHIFLDEERAFKVIRTELAHDPGYRDRFIKEAKLFSKLRHKNLVRLFEFGTLDENTFFVVSEFIHGETLEERIKKTGKLRWEQALRIIREAAEGLLAAHKQKLVHGNVSSQCIVLVPSEEGIETTKVIDFSLARPTMEEKSRHSSEDTLQPNLEYCSPESFINESEIDPRSDIYSLGITLYYMLSGHVPFQGSSPKDLMEKHLRDEPEGLADVPPLLNRVLKKALSKRKEDRQPFMEEFLHDLDRIPEPGATESWSGETVNIEKPAELVSGTQWAQRYVIETKIGKGGMGTVYKARDMVLNVPVALKTINKEITHNERTVERLKREVILARKVAHPNVCRIYDIGQTDGQHYVTMEYLEGKTLAQILSEQKMLPVEFGIPILKQVLFGLQEAHRVGVIHRDLKPQNIMVDIHGRAFIMDFGISVSEEVRRLTETGIVIGSPKYMSAEQLSSSAVGASSDIYSIGIIMFEMFTGRLPYDATTAAGVMKAHIEGNLRKPSEVTDLHPHLESVIVKAMQRDPQNRYQNVAELLSEMEGMEETPYAATIEISKTILLPQTKEPVQEKKQQSNSVWSKLKRLFHL